MTCKRRGYEPAISEGRAASVVGSARLLLVGSVGSLGNCCSGSLTRVEGSYPHCATRRGVRQANSGIALRQVC